MNATYVRHGVVPQDSTSAAAAHLIDTYVRTPPDDPRRPGMRTDAILAWTPMANRLARMCAVDRDIGEDLRQTALVALIKAVDGFDPTRGGDFVAYAVPTIRGELKRYFRDRSGALRAPRHLHDLHLLIESAGRCITQPLGRLPTPTDVADHLEVPIGDVLEALRCARARRVISLSEPMGPENGTDLTETLGAEDPGYRTVEHHLDLCRAFLGLDEREQRIVTLYFYGDLTQAEISRQIGVSQMHISRLLRGALKKLRCCLDGDPAHAPEPALSR
jgi:RNA polymerase sigma-B factor